MLITACSRARQCSNIRAWRRIWGSVVKAVAVTGDGTVNPVVVERLIYLLGKIWMHCNRLCDRMSRFRETQLV